MDDAISNIIVCGSVTFEDSTGTQVNIPFKVKIHCLDILIPVTDGLQDLLSAGALKASKSQKKTCLLLTNFESLFGMLSAVQKKSFEVSLYIQSFKKPKKFFCFSCLRKN